MAQGLDPAAPTPSPSVQMVPTAGAGKDGRASDRHANQLGTAPIVGGSVASGSVVGIGLVLLVRYVTAKMGLSTTAESWLLSCVPPVSATIGAVFAFFAKRASLLFLKTQWMRVQMEKLAECERALARLTAIRDKTQADEVKTEISVQHTKWERRRVLISSAIYPECPWRSD
jgi:hypothetical protein